MTDKELAEETVMSHAEEAIQVQTPYFKFAEQMFLEGLKAGREKWHKVADKPLPKETKNKIVARTVNGNVTMIFFFANAWREIISCREITDIYAWYEIPQF